MAVNVQIYKSKYYPGDAIEGVFTYTGDIMQLVITAKVDSYTIGQTVPNRRFPDIPEIRDFSIQISDSIFSAYPSLGAATPITINYNYVDLSGETSVVSNDVTTSAYLLSSAPPLLDIQSNGVGFMTSANTSGPCSLNIGGDKFINFYPIGSLYFSRSGVNPSFYFGGTWELFGPGRTIKGVSDYPLLGETESEITDGEKTHQLTINEMPAHTHQYRNRTNATSGSGRLRMHSWGLGASTAQPGLATDYVGGDQPHNNMQPYVTCYIWKRTG